MVPVRSSTLSSIGYDAGSQTLVIVFRSGARYLFHRVPALRFAGLLQARSHGRYFNRFIRGHFLSVRL